MMEKTEALANAAIMGKYCHNCGEIGGVLTSAVAA